VTLSNHATDLVQR